MRRNKSKKGSLIVLFTFIFILSFVHGKTYIARSRFNANDCFTSSTGTEWRPANNPCTTCINNNVLPYDGDQSENDQLAVACGNVLPSVPSDYSESNSITIPGLDSKPCVDINSNSGESELLTCVSDSKYNRYCNGNLCVATLSDDYLNGEGNSYADCLQDDTIENKCTCYDFNDLNCNDVDQAACFSDACKRDSEIVRCPKNTDCSAWGDCIKIKHCEDASICEDNEKTQICYEECDGIKGEEYEKLVYCVSDQPIENELIKCVSDLIGRFEGDIFKCYELININNECVETPTGVCSCVDNSYPNKDCETDAVWKTCSGQCFVNDINECDDEYHREGYNTNTCYHFELNSQKICEKTNVEKINCLGIEGSGNCKDDLIAQELGNCQTIDDDEPTQTCEEQFKRSNQNAYDCKFRNELTNCDWQDTSLKNCLDVMGDHTCEDLIYLVFEENDCEKTDKDNDGIDDSVDKCNVKDGLPVDDFGCSCNQKDCDDKNPCTIDSCNNGNCINNPILVSMECGEFIECPGDQCSDNPPYKFLDYPDSNYGYCEEGTCVQPSCELLSSDFNEICDVCVSEIEICDNKDNNCNDKIDENLERTCGVSNLGICSFGIEKCIEGKWTKCDAVYPKDEICDNKDNDCDGAIDNNAGCICNNKDERQCGTNIGECEFGKQVCKDNEWTNCQGSIEPSLELCDGLDNDCDGLIDEKTDELGSYSLVKECNIDVCIGTKKCDSSSVCNLINDIDKDNLCDEIDNCYDKYNPDQIDSDGDLIGDACDICPIDTANDADLDGYCENIDNCINNHNPNQLDSDKDGIGDVCDSCPYDSLNDIDDDGICGGEDNCPEKFNEDQNDCDKDGIGDVCDFESSCSIDSDEDGFNDLWDNCAIIYNPTQLDSDSDKIGDKCDPFIYDKYNDVDKDGKGADTDNCPLVRNENQQDNDNEGEGDVCDTCDYDPDNDYDYDTFCSNVDNCPNNYNPSQSDCDKDGIGDACDFDSSCSIDSDKDGVNDAIDNCPSKSNKDQEDSDKDFIGNACDFCMFDSFNDVDKDGICGDTDNCPDLINQNQLDSDKDRTGNACDICPKDDNNDVDNDNLCGNLDNCEFKSNPSQSDCDKDGIGDACDFNSKCLSDSDMDTIDDNTDNCPEIFNPTQLDKDGDSIGDKCDNCIYDPLNDLDNDGICGNIDDCPSISNQNQLDSDMDSFGDVCDVCPFDIENDVDKDHICGNSDNCRYKNNPSQKDCDNNNLGDACDFNSKCVGDSDGDGLIDYKDNCPSISNSDQEDYDNDKIGNECDICPQDNLNDFDFDSICGNSDNCPTLFNPVQSNIDKDKFGDLCDLCPNDKNNDIDEDSICGDLDTCPHIKNPNQETDCENIKVESEKYDNELSIKSKKSDIDSLIDNSYGTLNLSSENLKDYENLKKSIKVEKKEFLLDNEIYTRYKISIETEKPIHDFAYYQSIPKCLAKRTDNIYFNGKNYQIIETDPIIAWHFTDVIDKIEMTYDVKGTIPDSCLEDLKDFAYSSTLVENKKNTINILVPIIIIIIVVFIFLYFEQHINIPNSDKFDELMTQKAKEVKQKYLGLNNVQIRQELKKQGMNEKYISEILRRL